MPHGAEEDATIARLGAAINARIASGRITIPVLPAVACAVLALLDDPDADTAVIAATIRNDQSLAGHVMKFANSPLCRTGAPIVSLQQAIARLGMQRIAEIAFSACVGPKLFKAPAYAGLIDRVWGESLATAVWAREIARCLRRNVEVSFLCGLLHQIGRPVVLQAVQEALGPDGAPPAVEDVTALLDAYGIAAGLVVAGRWNLPESVSETIAFVDDFGAAPRSPELVAMVAAARGFAALTLGDAPPDAERLVAGAEMAEINLYRADIEGLLAQSDAVRATLREMAI